MIDPEETPSRDGERHQVDSSDLPSNCSTPHPQGPSEQNAHTSHSDVSAQGQEAVAAHTTIEEFTKERLKYEDPWAKEPSRKGLLLSNQIDWFCSREVLIESGFKAENVRPASYTLTIGRDYVDSNGRNQKLDPKKSSFFYMEPNSIVFVSTAEALNLPFYIAARFNLRVKWVYKGILLGTGPQVEPGFRGNLSCPLFNLTDLPIKIKLGDGFATIDFERTTDFGSGRGHTELQSLQQTMEDLDKIEVEGQRYLLFKQRPFPPLKHLPDHDIVSSLVQLSDEVKRWRAIGVGLVIAFVSLALALLNFQNNLYREQKATSQQVFQLDRDLAVAKAQMNAARKSGVTTPPPTQTPPASVAPTKPTRSGRKTGAKPNESSLTP
jgi:deoxycytidine triphosphate deaminase